jgi:hypothetical protein
LLTHGWAACAAPRIPAAEELKRMSNEALINMGYNPNTKYYFAGVLVVFCLAVVGYIVYINKELAKAGFYKEKKVGG